VLNKIIGWLQDAEIGEGDLTTESVTPYALHCTAELIARCEGLFAGRSALAALFATMGERVRVEWMAEDGDKIAPDAAVCRLIGAGGEILKNRRLMEWLAGRLSAIATTTRAAVTFLEPHGKKLVAGRYVTPLFESLDKLAFEAGGGEWPHVGLQDSIYLSAAHFAYGGQPEKVIAQVIEELGVVRKKIKIEVEVNTPAELEAIQNLDCDTIHLLHLTAAQIRAIFEKGDLIRKPVLHLDSLAEFDPTYAAYFFRYIAIENILQNIIPLHFQLKINQKE